MQLYTRAFRLVICLPPIGIFSLNFPPVAVFESAVVALHFDVDCTPSFEVFANNLYISAPACTTLCHIVEHLLQDSYVQNEIFTAQLIFFFPLGEFEFILNV